MSTLLLCQSSNPHRPPDWRWQLAKYLQENRLRLHRSQSDNYICWAKKFAIEIDNAADEWAQFSLAERSPAIYNAWALYKTTQLRNARWELEARLLARESRTEITRKTGLNSAIVDHYSAIFFDVEERLSHPTYVTHAVIGDAAKRGISEREPEVLWKMFGYWCGPDMLDLLVYHFTPAMKPKSSADIAAFLADDIRQQLQLKSAMAARSLQVNWQTQTEVLNLYLRMVELERNAGEGEGGNESLKSGIQSLLENLPWTRDAAVAAQRSLVHESERGGVVLRAHQLLLLAAGQTPEDLPAPGAGVYPPPIRRTTVSN